MKKVRAARRRVLSGRAFVQKMYAGGDPDVAFMPPFAVDKALEAKWIFGPGKVPLFRNSLAGFAVMRRLDARNEPHRTVLSCKMYLVWKGSARIRVEGRAYRLRRGQAMIVPPGKLQRVEQIPRGSVLLLFRSPDLGDTGWDKLDKNAMPFKKNKKNDRRSR